MSHEYGFLLTGENQIDYIFSKQRECVGRSFESAFPSLEYLGRISQFVSPRRIISLSSLSKN